MIKKHRYNLKAFFYIFLLLINTLTGCASSKGDLTEIPKGRFTGSFEKLLNGQWEGRLNRRKPFASPDLTKPPVAEDINLRVQIAEATKVFVQDDNEWVEVMANRLTTIRYGSNVTIIGFQADDSEKNRWVESWAILLTLKNDDEVAVEWVRMVNNLNANAPTVAPTFSMGAVGQMHRIKFN